jgi:hypothetical protein
VHHTSLQTPLTTRARTVTGRTIKSNSKQNNTTTKLKNNITRTVNKQQKQATTADNKD